MAQYKIPATYMRGGTSKGVFFRSDSLPADPVTGTTCGAQAPHDGFLRRTNRRNRTPRADLAL